MVTTDNIIRAYTVKSKKYMQKSNYSDQKFVYQSAAKYKV